MIPSDSYPRLKPLPAGRHDKVPLLVLKEATHFLKFSYAGAPAGWQVPLLAGTGKDTLMDPPP